MNSALGQPLSAEIELVALQPGELEALVARVASPEAYTSQNIQYQAVLRQIKFSVERRGNGQPYLKITSSQPINEPFLDLLIDMTWPSGRLQREYPILLDPPGFQEARVQPAAPAISAPSAPVATAPRPAAPPPPVVSSPAPTRVAPAVSAPAPISGDGYAVKRGDTLSKIAGEIKPADVSVEQMLVALYRENPGAFINKNMNLLRSGQILRVPGGDRAASIPQGEAQREIRVQVANWNAYRQGVASAVAAAPARKTEANTSAGQIASATPAKPAPTPAEPKDVLKVSQGETKPGTAGAGTSPKERVAALEEDKTAKAKAVAEAKSREADLQKQIADMKKVTEAKGVAAVPAVPAKPGDAKPATKEEPKVAAKPAEPVKVAEAPKPAEPPKPVETPKPAEPAKVAEAPKPAEPPKPAEAPKPAEPVKVAEAPKPVEPPKAAEAPKPAPKPAAKVTPPPPPEPSFMDTVMDTVGDPMVLGGGVIGLAGLGGLVMWMRRRKQAATSSLTGPASALTSAFPSDLKETTVTGKTAGGLVDTGNSSFLTDFDKTGPGTIDTDEVDPVAEAEVYIAYGRDQQAEEILKEAWSRDKSRTEVPLKLLEIYHSRKAIPQYEAIARELKAMTADSTPAWQKAAAMGMQIDPQNPLYSAAAASTGTFEAGLAAKPDLDFDLDAGGKPADKGVDLDLAAAAPAVPSAAEMAVATQQFKAPSLDFDLDGGGAAAPAKAAAPASLDFDLGTHVTKPVAPPESAAPAKDMTKTGGFDFDLSSLDFEADKTMPKPVAAAAAVAATATAATAAASQTLSLNQISGRLEQIGSDVERTFATRPTPPVAEPMMPDLNLGGDGDEGDAVATKLDLARAYVDIGDKDGAREILDEVMKEGSAAQKKEAEAMRATL